MELSDTYNLKALFPGQAKQWHPFKNGSLTPDKVTPGSQKKVWWICDKGHEWQVEIRSRTRPGKLTGCPYCCRKKVCKDNSLSTLHPKLAKQWHPTKNGNLSPDKVTPGSKKKVWWTCDKGHEWEAQISNRTNGTGCPHCHKIFSSDEYNLQVINPILSRQWHPTKNGKLTPDKVTPNSGKKIWWICDNGHEWQADINSRNKGGRCPYCSGNKASKDTSLSAKRPGLAKQWHPTKNGKLTPDKVTPNSGKKIWWICDNGHEWQAKIISRNNGSGCPYCSGNKASKENNLSAKRPDLAKQWHPTKNGKLTPDKVTPGSNKEIWWICDKGHEWKTKIVSRNHYDTNCPYCSHKKASKEYNLLIVNPGLAQQWHPVKNGELTPDQVTPHSMRKVWWVCHRGHEWKALIHSRARGTNCPKCASTTATSEHNLLIVNPEIAAQWHPNKNGDLWPDKVSPVSRRKVWWLCDKGHEWRDMIKERTRGNKCPYCFGIEAIKEYNFSSFHPDVAKQWHPTKNGKLTPDDVTPSSEKKVWWLCDKGHEWKARINDRGYGSGCPYCAGTKVTKEYNLLVLRPDIAKQWHPTKNGNLTPAKVMPYSLEKAWWVCDNDHEWIMSIAHRSYGSGCPYCAGTKVTKEYNLLALHPDIAKQWHPTKNGNLTPAKVMPYSLEKAWWICDNGHEWITSISNRSHGSGCPYCAGTKATKEYNLLVLHPDIAKQWHPTKNGSLTPDKVTPYSGEKVWWICARGHEWETTIAHRSFYGTDCPYCSQRKASKEYNLLTVAPDIAEQWHPVKNGELTPDKVTPASRDKVWWICAKGHEWKTAVKNRRRGSGCPYCAVNKRKSNNPPGA